MKKERLEELTRSCFDHNGVPIIKHIERALRAVERETVERCASVCVEHRQKWAEDYAREDKPQAAGAFDGGYMSAMDRAATDFRALLTED